MREGLYRKRGYLLYILYNANIVYILQRWRGNEESTANSREDVGTSTKVCDKPTSDKQGNNGDNDIIIIILGMNGIRQ